MANFVERFRLMPSDFAGSGWNWFGFARRTTMMCDVGYQEFALSEVIAARSFAAGTQYRQVDMMRGGHPIRAIRQVPLV